MKSVWYWRIVALLTILIWSGVFYSCHAQTFWGWYAIQDSITRINIQSHSTTQTITYLPDSTVFQTVFGLDTAKVNIYSAIGTHTQDTTSLSNRINTKLSSTDTLSLSSRVNAKVGYSDSTVKFATPYQIRNKPDIDTTGKSVGKVVAWSGSSFVMTTVSGGSGTSTGNP